MVRDYKWGWNTKALKDRSDYVNYVVQITNTLMYKIIRDDYQIAVRGTANTIILGHGNFFYVAKEHLAADVENYVTNKAE